MDGVKNVTPNKKTAFYLVGKLVSYCFCYPPASVTSSGTQCSWRPGQLHVDVWGLWVIPFLLTMAFDWVETIVRCLFVSWMVTQICIGYSSQNSWDWPALHLYQFGSRFPLVMLHSTNQFTHSAVKQKYLELVPPRSDHQQKNPMAFMPSQSKHRKVSVIPPESQAPAVSLCLITVKVWPQPSGYSFEILQCWQLERKHASDRMEFILPVFCGIENIEFHGASLFWRTVF